MSANDTELIERIGAELAQSDAVIVVGSDFSRHSGLPDHEETLSQLASFVNEGTSSNSSSAAFASADFLNSGGPSSIEHLARFMRQACRVGTAQPHAVFRKLVELLPSCFVATTYDCLLDVSLRIWRGEESFRVVSNSNSLETAELTLPWAEHFVFKPLGDVNDVNGIVLTQEHFDRFSATRPHVLDSMKSLLASRPVVFIGFRQDEPAFVFLCALLVEVRHISPGDRFAVLPDISELTAKKLREDLGLHAISYSSATGPSELSSLLDRLRRSAATLASADLSRKTGGQLPSAKLLALVRYAARLQHRAPEIGELLPMRITRRDWLTLIDIPYHDEPVEKFLRQFPKNGLLLGDPGIGKTFSLLRSAGTTARAFLDTWLGQPEQIEQAPIAIYLDLKAYTGRLWEMAQRELPAMLSLTELCEERSVRFLIDAANETPRDLIESGQFNEDLEHFLNRTGKCPVIFASRTKAPLAAIDLHAYHLDIIDPDFVSARLREHGVEPKGLHQHDFLSLMQKPYFFRRFIEGAIELSQGLHPREVFEAFQAKLSDDFRSRFGATVEVMDLLASPAYHAIRDAQETLGTEQITSHIRRVIEAARNNLDVAAIIDWLRERKVLRAETETHVAFCNHCLTEYFAAKELAAVFKADPNVLANCLSPRWNQTLLHALGFLDEQSARAFIRRTFELNILLAVDATAYVEFARDDLIDDILDEAIRWQITDIEQTSMLGARMRKLPFTETHRNKLEQLASRGDFLGADTAALLPKLFGTSGVPKLIEDMFARADDWNFCQSVGRELKSLATDEEIRGVVQRLGGLAESGKKEDDLGIVQGVSILLQGRPLQSLLEWFGPWDRLNAVQRAVLCRCLDNDESAAGCQQLVELLRAGARECVFPIYMRLSAQTTWESCSQAFDANAVNQLIDLMEIPGTGEWAASALAYVCRLRPELMHLLGPAVENSIGIKRIALNYALGFGSGVFEPFWSTLEQLADNPITDSDRACPHVLGALRQISWTGREMLLIRILKKRDWQLARPLLETFLDVQLNLDGLVEPLDWWWQWMDEAPADNDGWFFCNRLTGLLMPGIPARLHEACVDAFNTAGCRHRSVLKEHVLWYVRDLSTDQLSHDAINFLLADLHQQQPRTSHGILLGKIATETFVAEKLLPLLGGEDPLRINVQTAIDAAGRRFGRRF